MVNHQSINRSKCEACGAPLLRTNESDVFVCEYCGATYYSDIHKLNDQIRNKPHVPENHPPIPVFPNISPPVAVNKNKSNTWLWVSLLTIILSCLIFAGINGVFKSKISGFAENSYAFQKPNMLAALPSAEKAGKSIAYNGWEILVNPEISVHNDQLFIRFEITNWNDKVQTFNYTPINIVVYDDLGNTYNLEIGYCEIDIPYLERQLQFDRYEKIVMESKTSWCNQSSTIPTFSGVIPNNAKHLYIYFKDFGVFTNIIFELDL